MRYSPVMRRVTFFLAILLLVPASLVAQSPNFEQIAKQAENSRSSGKLQQATALYRQALRMRPSWTEGWWALGTVLYEQDLFPEAITAFRRFVVLAPKGGSAHAFLGLCQYETGAYDSALQEFQAWSRDGFPGPSSLKDVAVFHWALLLTAKGKFVESLYFLATEAAKQRTNAGLVEAMGLASLRIAKLPENYSPGDREMVWLAGRATLYSSLPSHDFERADEFASRLLSHYPSSPNVHYFRGVLYRFEQDDQSAKEQFRQELTISPRHAPALIELAKIDIESNELSEALSKARRAVDIEPTNPEGHQVLGRVMLAADQVADAARELETAKRLAPDSPIIRSHLATAYRRLGRTADAKKEAAAFLILKNREGAFTLPSDRVNPLGKPGQRNQ